MRLLFERLAERRPTPIVIEDWHWIDQPSIALLEHLLPLTRVRALSFWLSTRAEPAEPAARAKFAVTAIQGLHFAEIELGSLEQEYSGVLIENLVGAGNLPAAFRQQVLAKTGGNLSSRRSCVRFQQVSAQMK